MVELRTPPEALVEAVARALAEYAYANGLDDGRHPSPAAYADADWEAWTGEARAAVIASDAWHAEQTARA